MPTARSARDLPRARAFSRMVDCLRGRENRSRANHARKKMTRPEGRVIAVEPAALAAGAAYCLLAVTVRVTGNGAFNRVADPLERVPRRILRFVPRQAGRALDAVPVGGHVAL